MKIGDSVWHPCSMDIIEHNVVGVMEYETFTQYKLRSKSAVGACGIIEVIVSENNGKLRFVELVDEDNIEYSKGLGDFVEGFYYTSLDTAKLKYYRKIELHFWGNVDDLERKLKKAKKDHLRIKNLIKQLKDDNETA